MHDKPEIELIADGRQGDRAAISELFRRHYPSCLRLARGILRSDDESQDAVQSAYVSAFQHFIEFRGESSFRTWISRIVFNRCMVQRRTPWSRAGWVYLDDQPAGRGPDSLACHLPNPEVSAYSSEINSALTRAVSLLPSTLREAFSLYCVSGLSVKEVAETLGLSHSAAKTRVFRAREKVRVQLQPVWQQDRAA